MLPTIGAILDRLLQAAVVAMPLLLSVFIERTDRQTRDTPRFRYDLLACGVAITLLTVVQMDRESKNNLAEKMEVTEAVTASVTAIEAKTFADSLEHFKGIEQKEKELSSKLNTIISLNDSRDQKKKEALDFLNELYREGQFHRGQCNSVGPSGSGGSSAMWCVRGIEVWEGIVTGFLRGTLPPVFERRFQQAANVSPSPPGLDPTAATIDLPVRGIEAQMKLLKDFAEEVKSDKVKF